MAKRLPLREGLWDLELNARFLKTHRALHLPLLRCQGCSVAPMVLMLPQGPPHAEGLIGVKSFGLGSHVSSRNSLSLTLTGEETQRPSMLTE